MSEFNNAPIPNDGPAAPNGMRPAPIMPSPAPQGTTVCGIVGVVFGALGLVLSFIPIINNIAGRSSDSSARYWRSWPSWARSEAKSVAKPCP